jgi:Flp pilus assembly pilin Flp
MRQIFDLVRRFRDDERGAFAIIFGLSAIVLVALSGAVVDYVGLIQTRDRAQIALDAAALALQPRIFEKNYSEATIKADARALVVERIGDPRVKLDETLGIEINVKEGSLLLSGNFSMPTDFVQLVGVPRLGARIVSQAMHRPLDVEISLALDTTGSMTGQRLADLKVATKDLIDILVKDEQEPYYSKLAIVPYSQAVNVGTYAESVRGTPRQPRDIQSAVWANGSAKAISAITKANSALVTANGHGFSTGDWVYIRGVNGMTQLNNKAFQVVDKSTNTFELSGVNSSGSSYSSYTNSGTVTECLFSQCDVKVTSNSHQFQEGAFAHVTDAGGLTGLNNKTYELTSVTTNTAILKGSLAGGGGTHIANTGRLHCTWQNQSEFCTYYRFQNSGGDWLTFSLSTCATERITNAWNDKGPSTTLLGRNYPHSENYCLTSTIIPLTSNRTTLKAAADALVAGGSTGGHLGVAWSWYMLSPNFSYLWPSGRQPGQYTQANLLKAAIIMTDGEFNSVYCNGVIAKNSTTGSGNVSNQINCNAPNGLPYPQARQYCAAMKEAGIVVYTVGFQIHNTPDAQNLMKDCASSATHAYLASNGAELRTAFQEIGNNITSLRIAR